MNKPKDYQRYLALSSELFCTFQSDGKIDGLVGPWIEKIGLSVSGSTPSSIFSLIHPEDLLSFTNELASLKKSRIPFGAEIRMIAANGSFGWYEVKVILADSNEIFIFRALDISKQKNLILETASIKHRLELAIRAVQFGVWDWNIKTNTLIWDSYMYELFDLDEKDFTSDYEAFEKTLLKEDSQRLKRELAETWSKNSGHFRTEFRVITRHGKTRIIKAAGTCFYDGHGHIERLVGTNWDVTDSRNTEKKLKEAHLEIEKFFSISLDPLCVASSDGYFKRINKAFVDILGYTEDELTTQSFLNFVHPEDIPSTLKEIDNLKNGIPTLRFENRYRTKTGAYRHFNWVVVPDSENNLLYGVVRDNTEQIRSQHKALQSAQMASLGEMASGVAHEINNPLTIVQGKARQIERTVSSSPLDIEKVRSDLGKIVSTTDRIVKIIKGLRSFSRDSSRDPIELANVNSIVEDVLDLSSERFKNHHVDLRVDIQTNADIECRGAQIAQILMNLLNNGYDAVSGCDEKWVELKITRTESSVLFMVSDSGIGITPDVADKMMRPFFTTKGVGNGTGLGLSISKGIAEDHLGTLRFDSLSRHTCFVLDLPLRQPNQKQPSLPL